MAIATFFSTVGIASSAPTIALEKTVHAVGHVDRQHSEHCRS